MVAYAMRGGAPPVPARYSSDSYGREGECQRFSVEGKEREKTDGLVRNSKIDSLNNVVPRSSIVVRSQVERLLLVEEVDDALRLVVTQLFPDVSGRSVHGGSVGDDGVVVGERGCRAGSVTTTEGVVALVKAEVSRCGRRKIERESAP
jgi:hypothetical protein